MANTDQFGFTDDNRIPADLGLTDAERAFLVSTAKQFEGKDPCGTMSVLALRIDRLEQRVTDLMKAETRKHGGV